MMKIGIFGISRGLDYAKDFMHLDCEITAICERRKSVVDAALKVLPKDVKVYENFDEFIHHDMDAVVLANFFHEHTPYAIKCFERGLHVFSEVLPVQTMKEAVELIEAVEETGMETVFCTEKQVPPALNEYTPMLTLSVWFDNDKSFSSLFEDIVALFEKEMPFALPSRFGADRKSVV